VIADPDDTEQGLRVFDVLTAGRISIDEIHEIEDPSGSILRSFSKLYRRSAHPELSQGYLEGSTSSIFSRFFTACPLTPALSRCHRIWIEFFFRKTFAIQFPFHQHFFVKLFRTELEI
jgi:hypothetical protein